MSRAARLLQLMEVLRRHRMPVRGADLAAELGISLRSLYRDIATLQSQGAAIEGEAGLGYVLRPGFTLPSLMFDTEEVEALVLGCRWVAERGDPDLGRAAGRGRAGNTARGVALRARLPSSACAWPSPGANCARISATSAWTA